MWAAWVTLADVRVSAPRRGQPARSWAEEETADAMYYEHLHSDGLMQLGLLKPGGRAAHRFYLLAMARRRSGGEGGVGGEGGEGGGGSGGDGRDGPKPVHRSRARTDGERKRARRAQRAAARDRAGGDEA